MNPRLAILISAVALVTCFLLYKVFLAKEDLEIPPLRILIAPERNPGNDPA